MFQNIKLIVAGLTVFSLLAIGANAETHISLFDMVPAVSQIKSAVQFILGDKEGAAETQKNYVNDGLGPSQLRSGYFLLTGDPKKAKDIQVRFLDNLEPVVDSLPIVGHAKGIYHMIRDETDRGWQAIKASTSSVGTIIGAVAGGPAGAIGGHLITDMLISSAGVIITDDEKQLHGFVKYLNNIDKHTVGDHFDTVAGLALDAAGAKVGKEAVKANAPRVNTGNSRATYQIIRDKSVKENAGEVTLELAHKEVRPLDDGPRVPVPKQSYPEVSNDLTNRFKIISYRNFLRKDNEFSSLSSSEKWTSFSVNSMKKYTEENFIKQLEITTLTSKLKYLSKNQISLIERSDFRLVNTNPAMPNSLLCSVAGILDIDLLTLVDKFDNLRAYEFNAQTDSSVVGFLDMCKSKNLLDYTQSGKLNSLGELDLFIKDNFPRIGNKHLILRKAVSDNTGYAVVLKYKLDPLIFHPTKMFIDFQVPPMVTPNYPNPFRFENFIDDKIYNSYDLYIIEKFYVTAK